MEQVTVANSNSIFPRPKSLRAALLGAAAIATVGGFALESLPLANPAIAAAETTAPSVAPSSFADVVDHVKDAVVSVKVKIEDRNVAFNGDGKMDEQGQDQGDDQGQSMPGLPPGIQKFFRQFGAPGANGQRGPGQRFGSQQDKPHMAMAQGSGFFISADGYLVTNNHVVEHAKDVTVTTADGKTVAARVIGTDPKTDLALLKVKEGSSYPYVAFASKAPRVGDWVIAVGNPFGLGGTVTAGIVSARGRDIGAGPYDDFLQIDAPVNHGNSGGPTFNSEGQVVGVNTAIFSPSGGSVGIGFAIPSDVAKGVIQQLKDDGKVNRGWIGVQIQPVTQDIADSLGMKDAKGALVSKVEKDSPAASAGVKDGDVITAVNGQPVADSHDLARKIAELGPKASTELGIMRNGSTQTVKATLGSLADAKVADSDQSSAKDAAGKYGMTLAPANEVEGAGKTGVVVAEIDPDGVAAQKGIRTGDVILDVGGKSVERPSDVTAAIDAAKANGKKSVLMRLKNQDSMRYVALSTEAVS
jgi:serine protease Do